MATNKKPKDGNGKPARKCCSRLQAQRICRIPRSALIQFRDSVPGSKEQEVALATMWSFIDSYEHLLQHTARSLAESVARSLMIKSELIDLGLTNTRNLLAVEVVEDYVEQLAAARGSCRDEIRQRDLSVRLDEARRMLTFLRVAGDAEHQSEVLDHALTV